MKPPLKALLDQFWVALVAVFLLFCPYLASFTDDENRYCFLWGRSDMALILAATLLGAAVSVGIKRLVRRTGNRVLNRLFNHLFLLALVVAAAGNLAHLFPGYVNHPALFMLCWGLALAILAASWWRGSDRIVWLGVQVCKIMTPIVPIVCITAFMYPSYASSPEALLNATGPARAGATGVYVFVFDEWSYTRCFEEGRVSRQFQNLAAFADQAILFQNARSTGDDTLVSMPRLLFRTDLSPCRAGGRQGFERNGRFLPSSEMQSVFDRAAKNGYRGLMAGFLMNYRLLLGPTPLFCRSFKHDPSSESLPGRLLWHCWDAARQWPIPFWRDAYDGLYRRLYSRHWADINCRVHALALSTIRHQPNNTFAVFHYPLPHAPFIFDQSGYKGSYSGKRMDNDPVGYAGNLAYLDTVIGEIVAVFKESGKYDRSVIAFTSDHGWKADPDTTPQGDVPPVLHVPLLIRIPHESRQTKIATQFDLAHLGDLAFDCLLKGSGPEEVASFARAQCGQSATP